MEKLLMWEVCDEFVQDANSQILSESVEFYWEISDVFFPVLDVHVKPSFWLICNLSLTIIGSE